MFHLFIRQFSSFIAALIAASIIIFIVIEVLPGDPAEIMAGMNATPEKIAILRESYGLNEPAIQRYFNWIVGFFTGDLGTSYSYSIPVRDLILERFSLSLPLAIFSMFLTLLMSFPLGIIMILFQRFSVDKVLLFLIQLGIAIPNFLLALLFLFFFSVHNRWFPGIGFSGWQNGTVQAFHTLFLPALVLALPQTAILSRSLYSTLKDTLHEDYIRTARSKGLSHLYILWHHALPNTLPSILTLMGLQFSFLIGGTIIIENVFSLSGLGKLVVQALNNRDLIVVESVCLILVAEVILISFLIDCILLYLDPQRRKIQ